jgi:hypothetical protein
MSPQILDILWLKSLFRRINPKEAIMSMCQDSYKIGHYSTVYSKKSEIWNNIN